MSEVSANTPKRQAIVERLKQRIDSFRKHHDDCQTRLEKTQPSRELKQRQESQILHTKFMENKVKTNAKLRHDQVNSKIAKQEGGQEKSANNTGLQQQSSMKRRNEFPPQPIDGERTLQTNDDLIPPVPQKYPRFEGPNGVHCKIKPNFNAADGDPLHSSLAFPAVNGHNTEFPKSEEQSIAVSSYSGSTCENIDRATARSTQQYSSDYASTFTNRQASVSENSRTTDFPVNFKKENALVSPGNDGSTSIANGFPESCTKSEENFERLLTDYSNPKSKDDDLKSQISEFERVFQVIKNQDRNASDCEPKDEMTATSVALKPPSMQGQNPPLGNGLSDSDEVGKVSNQLALSNGPNNGTQLASGPTSPIVTHQQHGTISRATAQAVHQFIRTQQEERMTKVRYEKNYLLSSQGVTRDPPPRMTPRPNHNFAAIRQRVYEQIQQRRTNQQKSKIHGLRSPQLQARNPVMNAMRAGSPYQMHPRYPNFSPNTTQPVTFSPTARVQQNIMPQIHHSSTVQQQQHQGQMQGIPRHQLNMYAQQQKIAFQQQMASRLPSYSQAQHISHNSSMMDIRQKLPAATHTSHSAQYPLHQQVARTPQPLSHLQHYPNAYPNQPAAQTTRPVQSTYAGEYSTYQNPYGYNVSQDNKMHTAYQRHSSVDESLAANRYHNQDVNRTNFNFQRSSSLPGHSTAAKNVFNQTLPPVVRLGHTKVPDMNNNGNDHQGQDLTHIHPNQQSPLTHMKHSTNNLRMGQEHVYNQGNNLLAQSRPQTSENLQQTFSNSFTNLLDLKSNSESSLFPFLGQDVSAGSTGNTDFDSLLKSPPADFNLLNILENEPQKTL